MSDIEDNINFGEEFDDAIEEDQIEDHFDDDNESSDDDDFEDYNGFNKDNIEENNNKIPIRNNFLSIYEITMLIGYRASQISNGAISFLEEKKAMELCNPLLIAEEEFKQGLIPFDIIRHINVGKNIKNICLDVHNDLNINDVGNMI